MSQQEVIQHMTEKYHYDLENRKIKIKNKAYILHITKTHFEFHEERKEEDVEYIKQIIIKSDINVEVIKSFNFKDIKTKELFEECVDAIINNI